MPDKGERFGARVCPGNAMQVVDHRSVGHDLALRPANSGVLNLGGLDVEPFGRLRGQYHTAELRALDMLDLGGLAVASRGCRRRPTCRKLESCNEKPSNQPSISALHLAPPVYLRNCR